MLVVIWWSELIKYYYLYFQGIGRNYRIAKCTAAKCALKALRKMDHKKKK